MLGIHVCAFFRTPKRVAEIMEIVDRAEGSDNPDFTGSCHEKDELTKIIEQSTAKDYNYFL